MKEGLEQEVAALREGLAGVRIRDRWALEARLDELLPARNLVSVRRELERLRKRAEGSAAEVKRRAGQLPRGTFPEELPISARAGEIIELIRRHAVVVVAGETGSGKTTQLPKMCLEAGLGARGLIGCTQPRRVAATSVSRRIAEELKVAWGQEVGCKIRFADRTGEKTVVKVMTDGMLLSELQGDRLLSDYEAIIIDEAHERSLNIDFLLGYLNQLRTERPDLKVVITSATIDTELFAKAFGGAPVVEVSGRTYPVEVRYWPPEELLAGEDLSYVDAAVEATEKLVRENLPGDILVFFPTEKDIREATDALGGRAIGRAEVLPLFGRLTQEEQNRIFAPGQARRIILATNIAETSLTIPGIRFVVDTGLARLSRYSPQTHTKRLPIEPISQASADQRKGRCGRVREGICVRLYEEKDYMSRPRFTQPEIQRANLAEVILRMRAHGLGEMETFPFINAPQKRAIAAGYDLLFQLGALDEERELTADGRELARLPVDPTVGRMLLQARQEGSLTEVMAIAAGLSIQDPRERPTEGREAADLAHRRFQHEESDFLTLWKLWVAFHEETERLSQSQMRKFCKRHYLSYVRMREWRDIHVQLQRSLEGLPGFRLNAKEATYDAVHRALLAGLLGNVATKEEGNQYRGTHDRKVSLFPGSGLYDRRAEKLARKKKEKGPPPPARESKTPRWIVCAEWMETTRLYARTCARIDPPWILDLGRHLLRRSYKDPHWSAESGRVLATEQRRLMGLLIGTGKVGYGRIDVRQAEEIFLREGLVGDAIGERIGFLDHNRAVREKVETWQTRVRDLSAWALDERLYRFYAQHLQGSGISAVAELRRWLREKHGGVDDFLKLTEDDLLPNEAELDREAFPDGITVNGQQLSLEYQYKPGEENDGATLRVPVSAMGDLEAGLLDWAVPGYVEARVGCLLRALPKEKRRLLFPIAEKTAEVAAKLSPTGEPMEVQLAKVLHRDYGIRVEVEDWSEAEVPEHLRPRIEIIDTKERVVAQGRQWRQVREAFEARVRENSRTQGRGEEQAQRRALWKRARERFEQSPLTRWSIGDLDDVLTIGEVAGVPVEAFPALTQEANGQVALRLFAEATEAARHNRQGWRALFEHELGRELGWFERDLHKELERVKALLIGWADFEELYADARRHLLREYVPAETRPLREEVFRAAVVRAQADLRGLPQRFVDGLAKLLETHRELSLLKSTYAQQSADLARLLPASFLRDWRAVQVGELPRYLEGVRIRAKRAQIDPVKDAAKWKRLAPLVQKHVELVRLAIKRGRKDVYPGLDEVRWLLEELRISVFAQELGTKGKVSEKRVKEKLAGAENQLAIPQQAVAHART